MKYLEETYVAGSTYCQLDTSCHLLEIHFVQNTQTHQHVTIEQFRVPMGGRRGGGYPNIGGFLARFLYRLA